MAERLEELLRACTVRVTGGPMTGAGFFVAPGMVVTCAHVIGDSTTLTVHWKRDGHPSVEIPVVHRAVVLADGGRAIPSLECEYPDIAVVEVEAQDDQPCVVIDAEWPRQDDSFQAYGYPSEGGATRLTAAKLTYRGTQGTAPALYLDLARDTVKPGMSGAAVLNLRRGTVCGVIVASKHPTRPDGALAVPWSAIEADLYEVLAANQAFHRRDRHWKKAAAAPLTGGQRPRQQAPAAADDLPSVAVPPLTVTVRGGDAVRRKLLDLARRPGGNSVWVLAGAPGVGKSTMAAMAARAAEAAGWQAWWINASDTASLTGGMLKILEQLGAKPGIGALIRQGSPMAAQGTWEFLNSAQNPVGQRWLLVFDNADSPRVLAAPERPSPADGTGWLPQTTSGRVIVTTRRHDLAWWSPWDLLELQPLDEESAAKVLLDRAPLAGNFDSARDLARRLDCLPLMLHLAGCALGGHKFPRWRSFDEYRRALDSADFSEALDVLNQPGAEDRATVSRSWELALDALAAEDCGQARPLLALLACFAPQTPIPVSMLDRPGLLTGLLADGKPGAGTDDTTVRRVFWKGVQGLGDLGLIDDDESLGSRSILFHPLLADVIRASLQATRDPDPNVVGSTAARLLDAALDRIASSAGHGRETVGSYVPHVTAVLRAIGDMLDREPLALLLDVSCRLSRTLMTKNPVAAEQLARAAVSASARLGDGLGQVVTCRRVLAEAVGRQSRNDESERLLTELLAVQERTPGDDLKEILKTRHALARAIEYQSRYREAERLYRKLLNDDIQAPGVGEGDSIMTETRFRLAFAIGLRDRGRGHAAERHFHRVLRDRERYLPDRSEREKREKHKLVAQARHGLAWSMGLQGKWPDAEALFREVLADREVLLGGDDSATLATRYRIGWTLAGQARYREAERQLSQVAEHQTRILGNVAQATLRTRYRLACAIFDQGRRREAERMFDSLLADQERILGGRHQATLRTGYRLALAAAAEGGHDETRQLLRALYSEQRAVLGSAHPDTRDTQNALRLLGG